MDITNPAIIQLHRDLVYELNRIAAYFRNPKITLVVRNPSVPDGDVVLVADVEDPELAIAAIRRFIEETKKLTA